MAARKSSKKASRPKKATRAAPDASAAPDADPGPATGSPALLPDVINRLTRQINQITLEDLKRFGMTVPRWSVLAQLAVRDGRTIGDLSKATVIQQSSLTRVIDQMERDGLVERVPAEDDQRSIQVWLSQEGHRTYEEMVPLAVRRVHQALEGFREGEIKTLTALLDRLSRNVLGDRD